MKCLMSLVSLLSVISVIVVVSECRYLHVQCAHHEVGPEGHHHEEHCEMDEGVGGDLTVEIQVLHRGLRNDLGEVGRGRGGKGGGGVLVLIEYVSIERVCYC